MSRHPTAIVEDGARLAAGVEVGPFCLVRSGAELGEGVRLLSHVVIGGTAKIGARTLVHSHAVLGGDAQIRKGDARGTSLEIGADSEIREYVTISAGSPRGHHVTKVGERCYLMANSHIGHDCIIGNDVTMANGVVLGGHMEVGDGVIFGGLAAGQQHSRVGKYAFISGLSGISTDVIPYGMAIGLHVRLGGLNIIGLRRRGVPRPNIHALRAAFRAIFLEGEGRIADKAKRAGERWADVPEVQDVVSFILAKPGRPITPARRDRADAESDE